MRMNIYVIFMLHHLLSVNSVSRVFDQIDRGKEVMQALSYSFGLGLLECGDVANATKAMEEDVYNYWNIEYNLTHISTGCLVLCSMAKLELLDGDGRLMRANAEGYVRANGADDEVLSKLESLYNKCRTLPVGTTHPCAVALVVARCFRRGIHELQWTPDISSLLSIN